MGANPDLHIIVGLAVGWLCCRLVAVEDTNLFWVVLLSCYVWGEAGIRPAITVCLLIGFVEGLRKAVLQGAR